MSIYSMEQHGISKLDLKRQNRMHVLKILKQRGPTSRIDIAGALELTRAAVTIITNEMIEQGIITELGEYKQVSEKTPRGRKKILIDINSNFKFAVGITIECSSVSVGISTLSGAALDKRNLAMTDEYTYEDIMEFIRKSVQEEMADNCIESDQLLGVGVGIYPGVFERLGIPVVDGAPDYSEILSAFEKEFMLPVVIDNSVKGMAMANIDFLKEKDEHRKNIAFLQYGDSIHYIFTNLNDPIVSYDNRTDFVNRIILDPLSERVCECGRRGCSSVEITPSAVIKKIAAVFSREKTPYLYELLDGDPSGICVSNIVESFNRHDPGTVTTVIGVLDLVAVLLNNLYHTTNPQKIVLHNMAFTSDAVLPHLMQSAQKIGSDQLASTLTVSIIDEKQRFLGGCALAIRELFFDKGGFVSRNTVKR